MKLRNIEFGNVFCAPGARGFFGEGYWYHLPGTAVGLTWRRTTFVAKTTTLEARVGNMPLKTDHITPLELRPKCIIIDFRRSLVLNAVGLSGPGFESLADRGRWQLLTEPFMLSFMSVADTADERIAELESFIRELLVRLPRLKAPVALQLNFGCPNTEHAPTERFAELATMLDMTSALGIPIVVNFSVAAPIDIMVTAAKHPACDALWIANTVPWGDPRIDWVKLFGSPASPLTGRGFPAGGLSGPPCLPIAISAVKAVRAAGVTKPIIAGNGVLRARDVSALRHVGTTGIAIGTVAMLRPWRMRSIITAAQ
jgi:dihydroorotate dehydrogenase